jgi:hypothetical protein
MSKFKIKPRAPKRYQDGGMVEGPSHEEGGIEAYASDGTPVAEIEGGERIFSVQDTAEIEAAVSEINSLSESDPEAADQMAMKLGYRVAEMIVKQEQINPS